MINVEQDIDTIMAHRNGFLLEGSEDKDTVVYFIHGGGFCFKSPLDNDIYCDYVSKTYGLSALNVDFTSSGFAEFPIQLTEIVAEYKAMLKRRPNLRNEKFYVVGHSSGANLAAAVVLWLRRKGIAVNGLILNYPYLDLACDPSSRPVLENAFPDWLLKDWNDLYCPFPELRDNPLVSPLKMSLEEAALFPPTYIITSEFDRLHDDGVAFAALLTKAGGICKHFRAQNRHGFIERGMAQYGQPTEGPETAEALKRTQEEYLWLLQQK
jgi:acetyl esterase